MTVLTWKDVAAPTFSGVGESQLAAAAALKQGFSGLSDALGKFKDSQDAAASAQYLQNISKYTDANTLGDALRSGSLVPNGGTVSTDALKIGLARQGDLLNLDTTRLNNASQAEKNSQTQWEDATKRGYEENRPAALAAATEIRNAFSAGTPEGNALGQSLTQKYAPIFGKAGMSVDDALKMNDNNTSAAKTNLGLQDDQRNSANLTLQDKRIKDASAAVSLALKNAGGDAPSTVRYLQGMNIEPETLSLAVKQVQDNSGSYFGAPVDPQQAIIDQGIGERQGNRRGGDAITTAVNRIVGAESGGNANSQNALSSASGLGGFIDSTWLSTVRKYRPDIANGRSNEQILALKNDPALGREMTTRLTEENANYLQNHGLPVTPGNIYLAHFSGQGGANAVLHADPSASVESVLGSDVIKANPFLKSMTIADMRNWADKKMGGPGVAPSASAGPQGAADDSVSAMLRASDPRTAAQNQQLYDDSLASLGRGQQLIDTMNVDGGLNKSAALLTEITSPNNAKIDKSTAAQRLYDTLSAEHKGDGPGSEKQGSIAPDMTLGQLTDVVNQVSDKYGVPPNIAAALIKDSVDQNTYFTRWAFGERGPVMGRIDSKYHELFDDQGKPTKAVAQLAQLRNNEVQTSQIKTLSTQVQAAQQEYFNAVARSKTQPGIDTNTPRLRYEAMKGYFDRQLEKVDRNPLTRANSK